MKSEERSEKNQAATMKPMGTVTFFLILRNDPFFSIHSDSPELLLLSSPLHSVKNASSLSLRCLSPAATSGEETFDFCISRQLKIEDYTVN
ncbi:hypothetical protein P8452_11967 [Trifolium repens]|nr:hypothetical protein P8452_11967 [Trifolium repens]